MINQKAISAKLDYDALEMIDKEARVSCKSRNRIINDAICLYCASQDLRRTLVAHGIGSRVTRIEVAKYLKQYVSPEAHVYVDMIDY